MVNTITNRQMFYIILLTLTSYNIINIAKLMAESAGTGAWLPIILMSVVAGIGAVIITSLNIMFQGKTIVEYAAILITKPGAVIISCIYVLYLLLTLVYLTTQEAKILNEAFFVKSPVWVFPLISIPLYCYISIKGISAMARTCEIIGALFIITGTIVHIIMLFEGELSRILPLFNLGDIGSYISGFDEAIPAFLPLSVLLALPLSKKACAKANKTAFITLIITALFYILVVYTSFMKTGVNDITQYDDALIVSIRETAPKFLEVVARLDILFLTVGFAGLFIGSSVIMTVITELICRIFTKANRIAISIIMGVLVYGFFLIAINIRDFNQITVAPWIYISFIFSLAIPLLLLILGKLKKTKEKKNAA